MKATALTGLHVQLGAKMVPFAGFNMPVQYSGINEEHETVRKGVGVFDVSHMGEFIVKGPHALALVQKVSSNDAAKLFPGKIQYAYMPNTTGGVIDDLLVYCIDPETFMLVVNAGNIEKDWNWIQSQNTMGAEIVDISDRTSLFAVQGPKAAEALQDLTEVDLSTMEYYTFRKDKFAGIDNVVISATGYTGAGGFEIYVENDDAKKVWDAIFGAGASLNIKPIGLGARDTLRLEMGFCLYGHEIDENTSPLEAGLGWVTKFTKDFINSENLKAEKEKGLENKLVGFELVDRGIARQGYEILDVEGNVIGLVTSGTQSPTLKKSIGMGFVPVSFSKDGATIYINIRNNKIEAKVSRPPFVK